MKEDVEKMVEAYLEVYEDFERFYDVKFGIRNERGEFLGSKDSGDIVETVELFRTALQDKLLGEMLRQEIIEKYAQLKEEEEQEQQAQQAEMAAVQGGEE